MILLDYILYPVSQELIRGYQRANLEQELVLSFNSNLNKIDHFQNFLLR